MDKQSLSITQRGIAPLLILIVLAGIIAAGILAYSYFMSRQNAAKLQQTQGSPPPGGTDPFQISGQTDPRNCSDTDYTGCDTSADFMTWNDDGERNPPESTVKSTILEK